MLTIQTLGALQMSQDAKPIRLSRARKIEALLLYLVIECDRPHPRPALHSLLFSESTEQHARTALRQTFHRIRQIVPETTPPYFFADRETIQFNQQSNYHLDFRHFSQLTRGCEAHQLQQERGTAVCPACISAWKQAIALYKGDFLADFHLPDNSAFNDWVDEYREMLRQTFITTVWPLLHYYQARNQYDNAIQCARRLIEVDAWDEEAHRMLLRLMGRAGQRNQAILHYDQLCKTLMEELGVEPERETAALIDQIKRTSGTRPHNLPTASSSFVGRQSDITALHTALAHPDKRLVTILGGGGMGKTRLALEVARNVTEQKMGAFMHGVYFVSLVEIDTADLLPTTIAAALNIPLQGKRHIETQLFDHLAQDELLIVLDNFEQLVGTAVPFLNRLLKATQHVKLLVTSRIHINLTQAWAHELGGLPIPPLDLLPIVTGGATALPFRIDPNDHAALTLFLERAGQVMDGFAFEINERTEQIAMLKICEMVEGLPLALELAASWIRVMSCEEIAAAIQHNLDVLQTQNHDMPDRHRSVRAVFMWSWELLSSPAQQLLAQLSLFRGDFGRDAAQSVSGATLLTLTTLIDHSLLQRHGQKRYRLHELVRQFAADMLPATEHTPLANRHAAHYAQFTEQYVVQLSTAEQTNALNAINGELSHIRTAWLWLTEQAAVDQVAKLAYVLQSYFTNRSQFREALTLFEAGLHRLISALEQTPQRPGDADQTLSELLMRIGEYHYSLGQFDEAETQLQASLRYSLPLKNHDTITPAYLYLGVMARLRGQPLDSEAFLLEGLKYAREDHNQHNEGFILMALGAASIALGAYETAATHLTAALTLFQSLEYQFGIAHTLRWHGILARYQEAFTEAHDYFTQSLAMCEKMGDRQGEAMAYNDLSRLALLQERPDEAHEYSQNSLRLDAHNETPIIKADCLRNLGIVSQMRSDFDGAHTHLHSALQLATQSDIMPLALSIALDVVDKLMIPANNQNASLLAETIANHAAAEWHTKQRADALQLSLAHHTNDANGQVTTVMGSAADFGHFLYGMLNGK